ncbi:MAG: sigma-54-dependent Fis family transcriptional regulator [Candidatus Magnetomorum sp.]|nr:sigma-54-dependent Fis family transcriptional regulator [Candidatus Magnetomorum sp.]
MRSQAKNVLLVDDEEKLLGTIARRMTLLGFTPFKATSGPIAIEIAKEHDIGLAIVDLQMPGMDGLETITQLKKIHPHLKTILLTGHGNNKIKQATEALDSGYFEKDDMVDFWKFIKNLNTGGQTVVIRPARSSGLSEGNADIFPSNEIEFHPENNPSQSYHSEIFSQLRIIGETEVILALRKNIKRLGALDCPVLLRGEAGTGKEFYARSIHANSTRYLQQFIAIDCTSFSNEQLIAQLLGYKKGTFSNAIQQRMGIFSGDPVGTLFFDNVEDLSLQMQSQLFEIIETISSRQSVDNDIRLIFAAETDLEKCVQSKTFRKDLYERLTLFEFYIPPLRNRKDDIPPLCRYFLDRYRQDFKKPVESISPKTMEMFMSYDFPGNVRELQHIIERAVILADSQTIDIKHMPVRFQKIKESKSQKKKQEFQTLAEIESQYITEVLGATNDNKSRTSEILGISRAALWRKLKQIKKKQG